MNGNGIAVADSAEALQALSGPWNGLLRRSAADSAFLTWEWLSAWCECFLGAGRRPFVLSAYRGGELVGIAPWCLSRRRYGPFPIRQIEFLGSPEGGSDYLDVIAEKGREREVASLVYDFLFGRARSAWDAFLFRDVPANSPFLAAFLACFRERGKSVGTRAGSFCPSLTLPRDREAFLSTLSANRRQQYRRHARVMSRGGALRHVIGRGREGLPLLGEFRELYARRRGPRDSLFGFLEKFIARDGDGKAVQVDLLTRDGIALAGAVHLDHGGRRHMYLLAVDAEACPGVSAGNVLIGMSVERSIEDGCTTYDFLKGEERYKFHWTDGGILSLTISHSRRSAGAVLRHSAECFKEIARVVLR